MGFGPWRFRLPVQEVGGASGLRAQVRTNHTHLCNIVILVRPFQEGVREPQARDALKHRKLKTFTQTYLNTTHRTDQQPKRSHDHSDAFPILKDQNTVANAVLRVRGRAFGSSFSIITLYKYVKQVQCCKATPLTKQHNLFRLNDSKAASATLTHLLPQLTLRE